MKFHRVTCENNLFKYLKLKLEFEKRKEKINRFEMNLYFSLPSSEEVSFVLRNYFLVIVEHWIFIMKIIGLKSTKKLY